MPIDIRNKAIAGIVLAVCTLAAAVHASHRRAVDPCDADPGAYACAMFAQPEWLKRRVYAGRMETRPAVAPAVEMEPVAVSAGVPERDLDGI